MGCACAMLNRRWHPRSREPAPGRAPGNEFKGRVGAAVAADPSQDRVALFGGQAGPDGYSGGTLCNDLWLLAGGWCGDEPPPDLAWRRVPAHGAFPARRKNAAAAFDRCGRLWLVGGETELGLLNDVFVCEFAEAEQQGSERGNTPLLGSPLVSPASSHLPAGETLVSTACWRCCSVANAPFVTRHSMVFTDDFASLRIVCGLTADAPAGDVARNRFAYEIRVPSPALEASRTEPGGLREPDPEGEALLRVPSSRVPLLVDALAACVAGGVLVGGGRMLLDGVPVDAAAVNGEFFFLRLRGGSADPDSDASTPCSSAASYPADNALLSIRDDRCGGSWELVHQTLAGSAAAARHDQGLVSLLANAAWLPPWYSPAIPGNPAPSVWRHAARQNCFYHASLPAAADETRVCLRWVKSEADPAPAASRRRHRERRQAEGKPRASKEKPSASRGPQAASRGDGGGGADDAANLSFCATQKGAALPAPRERCAAAVLRGHLVVSGGCSVEGAALADLWSTPLLPSTGPPDRIAWRCHQGDAAGSRLTASPSPTDTCLTPRPPAAADSEAGPNLNLPGGANASPNAPKKVLSYAGDTTALDVNWASAGLGTVKRLWTPGQPAHPPVAHPGGAQVASVIQVVVKPEAPATFRKAIRTTIEGDEAGGGGWVPGQGDDVACVVEGGHPMLHQITLRNTERVAAGSMGKVASDVRIVTDDETFATVVQFADAARNVSVSIRLTATLSAAAKRKQQERHLAALESGRHRDAMLALFRQRDARRAERMAAVEDQETTRVVERALEAEAMEQIRAAELARQEEMAAFEATRREEEYHRASERVREAAMDAARAAEAAEIASRADRAAAVQKDLELRAKKMQLAEEDLELQTTALNRERQLMSREREQGARERQWVKQKDEEYDKERRRYEAAAEGLKKRLAAAEEQGRAWQAERDHALAQLDDAVRSRKALALELDAVHGRSPSETDADWQSRRTERAKYLSLARKGEFADGPLRLKIKSAAPEQVAYFTIGSTLPVPLTCETSVTFGSAPAGGGAVGRLESGAALKQAQLIVDVEHGFIEGDTLIFANTRLTEGGRLTTLSGEVLGEYVPSLSRRASGRPSLFAGSEHDPAFDGKPKDAAPARRRSRSSSRATRKSRSASVLSAVFPGNFFSTSAALAVHSQALGAPPAQQQASAPADQDPAEPADEISTARVAVTPGGATVAEVCRSAERLLALLCFKAAGGPAPAKPAAHAPWDDASPRAAKASAGQKTAGHAQQPARQSDGLLHVGVRRVSITLSVNDARVEGWRLVEVLPAVAVVPETCRLSTYVEGKGPIRLYGSVAFSGITEMAGRARDMVRTCALCGLCLDEDGHARCGGEERKPAVPQPDEDSDVFKPIPSYAVTAAGGYLSLRAVKGWSDDDVLLLTEGCSFEVRSERSKARSVVHTLWYATQYETYDAGVDGISIERAGDGPQFKLIGCFRTGLIAHADHTAGGGDRLDAESAPTGSGGGDTGGGGTTTSTVPRAAAVKLGFLHGSIPSVDGSACSVGVQFNQEATWGMVEEFVRSVCFRNDSINPTRPRRLIELVFTCGRPKGDPPPEAKTLSLGSTRRAPDAWWDALPPAAVQFSFVSEINVVNVDEPTEIHVLSEDLRYSLPSQFLSDDLRTAISVPSRLPFCKGARVVDEDTDVFCEGVLKVYLDALSDTERVVFDPSASDNVSVGPHKHVKQAVYHRKKPVAALLETPDQ
ncbi:hypothetical protein DIPPA_29226, partial [Diplonema papillatum]